MKLQLISYDEWPKKPQEWSIENLYLQSTNLIVGKNSTGKSRALAVISALANILSNASQSLMTGNFKFNFYRNDDKISYELNVENRIIQGEHITLNGGIYLTRGADGYGKILSEKEKNHIEFKIPPHMMAACIRRDNIHHPLLEDLSKWAESVRLYHFANDAGKGMVAPLDQWAQFANDRNEQAAPQLFWAGESKFGEGFVSAIKRDLEEVDYPVKSIEIGPPVSIVTSLPPLFLGISEPVAPSGINCLRVQEAALSGFTDQYSMSNGMFRVLSILIHLNLALLTKQATTIMIDDIGEGLDFERSKKLISLLLKKAKVGDIQLIMTSNDHFVMNSVPIEQWTLLHRTGSHVVASNYKNQKERFDNFNFTGLSNCTFFEVNADELSSDDDNDDDDDGEEGYSHAC